jgi:hypothetical protein
MTMTKTGICALCGGQYERGVITLGRLARTKGTVVVICAMKQRWSLHGWRGKRKFTNGKLHER